MLTVTLVCDDCGKEKIKKVKNVLDYEFYMPENWVFSKLKQYCPKCGKKHF